MSFKKIIIIDSELTFEKHIMEKVKKANSLAGLIRRSFSFLSPSLFRILFTTFVRPHLEYGQSIWSPHLRKHIDLMEGVQRRATKFVDKLYHLSYEERLAHVNLLTLEESLVI